VSESGTNLGRILMILLCFCRMCLYESSEMTFRSPLHVKHVKSVNLGCLWRDFWAPFWRSAGLVRIALTLLRKPTWWGLEGPFSALFHQFFRCGFQTHTKSLPKRLSDATWWLFLDFGAPLGVSGWSLGSSVFFTFSHHFWGSEIETQSTLDQQSKYRNGVRGEPP
jgi:hypothetical protein